MYERTKAPAGYDPDWLDRELRQLEASFRSTDYIRLVATTIDPPKPRTGEIRFADGTEWDPGSGEGFYGFYGGLWVKLG